MIHPEAQERLFGVRHAFDHPVTLAITIGLAFILLIAPFLIQRLARKKNFDPNLKRELMLRYYSWLVIVPTLLIPILIGAFWMMVGVGILSLLCYREYARSTGLFRERAISFTVVIGIVTVTLSVIDNWYPLFVALTPLTVGMIAIVAIFADRPQGYIQRVALGVLAFLLFGTCFSHLGYMGNDEQYRPFVLMIFLCVELNDVFAYIVGKRFGKHPLAPNTSPKKTVEGAIGAVVLTTLLVVAIGFSIYPAEYREAHGIRMEVEIFHWAMLGIIISIVGQLGDLMISSIKRDLGLKDMGVWIPGHGGLLDRFDSLILVAPAAFHYANHIAGYGRAFPMRVFTGG
jgi:phosphatidate cytidylyltransferase